jgi:mono/diheme cytochrome c family protein
MSSKWKIRPRRRKVSRINSQRAIRWASATMLVLTAAAVCLPLLAQSSLSQTPRRGGIRRVSLTEWPVTPVTGRSWLRKLGIFLDDTSMGKTSAFGPSPEQEEVRASEESWMGGYNAPTVVITGADLYRLDCQQCHRADGNGVPGEINSMINPVRATSPELIREHMKKVGAPISLKAANEMASQARVALLQRLTRGGAKMPAFTDLNPLEAEALIAYIDQLAGVPGAEHRQIQIEEPVMRIGEHLVKATCHICHDASGSRPSPQAMLEGEIPPLAVVVRTKTAEAFVRKVTHGATVMGTADVSYRGRMPVFYYVQPEEAAAAYMYLRSYPPDGISSNVQTAQTSAMTANTHNRTLMPTKGATRDHK